MGSAGAVICGRPAGKFVSMVLWKKWWIANLDSCVLCRHGYGEIVMGLAGTAIEFV